MSQSSSMRCAYSSILFQQTKRMHYMYSIQEATRWFWQKLVRVNPLSLFNHRSPVSYALFPLNRSGRIRSLRGCRSLWRGPCHPSGHACRWLREQQSTSNSPVTCLSLTSPVFRNIPPHLRFITDSNLTNFRTWSWHLALLLPKQPEPLPPLNKDLGKIFLPIKKKRTSTDQLPHIAWCTSFPSAS
jgi:hypothetical protein